MKSSFGVARIIATYAWRENVALASIAQEHKARHTGAISNRERARPAPTDHQPNQEHMPYEIVHL